MRPFVTNSIRLTVEEEETATDLVTRWFEKVNTEDFTHFSFEGTHLNLKSSAWAASWEVHADTGSFVVVCDLSKTKKVLKSTLRLVEI